MRHIIINLFIFSIVSSPIKAQCLQNGDFYNACGETVTAPGQCPTWTDNCGAGWIRSHGTPQMIKYCEIGYDTLNYCKLYGFYAYMWSRISSGVVYGEGMFTPYSFQLNHTYQLTIRVNTYNSDLSSNNDGSVLIYATNSLLQSQLNCTQSAPNIPSTQKQLIGQINGLTNGWQNFPFNFTANANYNQLWIYGSGTSTVQYNIQMMKVTLCPLDCNTSGILIYNTGVVPGDLSESGQIFAGSSAGTGGSGTVTLQQTQSTLFVAATEIDLLPSFQATVSSGNNFTGLIDPNFCEHNYHRDLPYDTITNIPLFKQNEPMQNNLRLNTSPTQLETETPDTSFFNDLIKIYPTINNGVVYITGNKKELTNAEFMVYNSLGKIVFIYHNYSDNKAKLDLTYLAGGVYYLQVKSETGSTTQKIIIQH